MNVLMTLINPFTNDPRVYSEAKSLIKAGHKVTILARDIKKENPINEIKDGIRKLNDDMKQHNDKMQKEDLCR